MSPEQIEVIRKVLDDLARENTGSGECSCRCCVLEGAAAEYLRLHDAIQRLYSVTGDDVRHETDQFDCDVHAGTLADIVERTARRFLE